MDLFIDWFFISWEGVVRVLVTSVLAYVGLVLLLRISGKRTLTKLNAFDLVVTVALGSTLATILLSNAWSSRSRRCFSFAARCWPTPCGANA